MCATQQPTDVGKRKVELQHVVVDPPAAAAAVPAPRPAPAPVAGPPPPPPAPIGVHVCVTAAALAEAGGVEAATALLVGLVTKARAAVCVGGGETGAPADSPSPRVQLSLVPATGSPFTLNPAVRHALYFELPGDSAAVTAPADSVPGRIVAALRAALGASAAAPLLKLKHVVEATLPFALGVEARAAAPTVYAVLRGGHDWAYRACNPVSLTAISPEEELRWECGAKSAERDAFWAVRGSVGRQRRVAAPTPAFLFPRRRRRTRRRRASSR